MDGDSASPPTTNLRAAPSENSSSSPRNCVRTTASSMVESKWKSRRSSLRTSGARTRRKRLSCASSAPTEKPGRPSRSSKEEKTCRRHLPPLPSLMQKFLLRLKQLHQRESQTSYWCSKGFAHE